MQTSTRPHTHLRRIAGPLVSAVEVAGISVALWLGLEGQQNRQIRHAAHLAGTAAARELARSTEFRGRETAAFAEHFRTIDMSAAATDQESLEYFALQPHCELIVWVNAQQHVRWMQARSGSIPEWLPQIVTGDGPLAPPPRHRWTARRVAGNKLVISSTVLSGGAPNGAVLAVYDAPALTEFVLQNVDPNYNLTVSAEGRELYQRSDGSPRPRWVENVSASVPGVRWEVTAWPGESALTRQGLQFPVVVLVTGLLLAAVLSAAIYLAQLGTQRAGNLGVANQLLQDEVARRKQSEEAVRRANAYNRSLIEASLDPLVTIGPEGKIQDVNAATEAATGCSRAELIGTDFSDYFTDPENARAGYQQVFREGFVRDYPLELRHRDGATTAVLYNASVYCDESGGVIGVFAAARDVTEQKRLEQQLRDQQFYTRSLIEASIDAMMTTDPAGTITDVNEQMEALTGHSRSELIGTPFKTFFTEPERAQEGIELVLRAGEVTDYELTARSKSGHETVVSYNATTFKDRSGKLQGVFAAARDITERKRAESELERSNRELQDFASIASHDLQEPLRKISAFGERLRGHCAAQLDATGLDYLQRMENAAERMGKLIERLLEYSRVSTRAHPFERVDLQATLFEVIADLEPRIYSSGARVIAGLMPWVDADRMQMRELLQNLLANALKFHPPDACPEVEVEAHRDGPWQEVIVRDHGIGFDESYLDRIFRPFQRLHGRAEFEGTGMGLAICRKIVARHGGDIRARSRLGQGSEFIVRLPAERQPEGGICPPLPITDTASPSSSPKTMTMTTS